MLLGWPVVRDAVSLTDGLTVAVIVVGVTGVGYSAMKASGRGGLLSLAAGSMIAGYDLADRRAMSLPVPPNPLEYLFLMHVFLWLFISAGVFLEPGRRRGAWTEWRVKRFGVILAGILTPLAYFLIVLALRYGNVTCVAAGRNVGIVISAAVGALILKERVTRIRLAGASAIAVGVALLATLGPDG
ncbi:MAG: DMT family transporter [Proteobacteria bacterium]|nr:DMT family transporter [Pseudomonadota bacterium]